MAKQDRLTAEQRRLQGRMLSLLEWLTTHPKVWYDMPRDAADQKVVDALEAKGAVEIRQPMNQYRLKKS